MCAMIKRESQWSARRRKGGSKKPTRGIRAGCLLTEKGKEFHVVVSGHKGLLPSELKDRLPKGPFDSFMEAVEWVSGLTVRFTDVGTLIDNGDGKKVVLIIGELVRD